MAKVTVYYFQDEIIKDTMAFFLVAYVLVPGSFILGEVSHHVMSSFMEQLA